MFEEASRDGVLVESLLEDDLVKQDLFSREGYSYRFFTFHYDDERVDIHQARVNSDLFLVYVRTLATNHDVIFRAADVAFGGHENYKYLCCSDNPNTDIYLFSKGDVTQEQFNSLMVEYPLLLCMAAVM